MPAPRRPGVSENNRALRSYIPYTIDKQLLNCEETGNKAQMRTDINNEKRNVKMGTQCEVETQVAIQKGETIGHGSAAIIGIRSRNLE